jgi:hypothetical protein
MLFVKKRWLSAKEEETGLKINKKGVRHMVFSA